MGQKNTLFEKLSKATLDDSEIYEVFEKLVQSLSDKIGIELNFDVQEDTSEGVLRCNAYDKQPLLGDIELTVTANIVINRNDGGLSVIADI